ncbi:hypothetical protein HDK77DRAFT_206378 [Phyllosticta capitalensis]
MTYPTPRARQTTKAGRLPLAHHSVMSTMMSFWTLASNRHDGIGQDLTVEPLLHLLIFRPCSHAEPYQVASTRARESTGSEDEVGGKKQGIREGQSGGERVVWVAGWPVRCGEQGARSATAWPSESEQTRFRCEMEGGGHSLLQARATTPARARVAASQPASRSARWSVRSARVHGWARSHCRQNAAPPHAWLRGLQRAGTG